jgi:hypothetical protein
MRGLDPRIHLLRKMMGGRIKPGHGGESRGRIGLRRLVASTFEFHFLCHDPRRFPV